MPVAFSDALVIDVEIEAQEGDVPHHARQRSPEPRAAPALRATPSATSRYVGETEGEGDQSRPARRSGR